MTLDSFIELAEIQRTGTVVYASAMKGVSLLRIVHKANDSTEYARLRPSRTTAFPTPRGNTDAAGGPWRSHLRAA